MPNIGTCAVPVRFQYASITDPALIHLQVSWFILDFGGGSSTQPQEQELAWGAGVWLPPPAFRAELQLSPVQSLL